MSFLPPAVMELRANASQFISEQGRAASAAKSAASETAAAAQKAATASRTASAQAVAATDKRIAAEAAAAEATKKANAMQANSLGVMTQKQKEAYDKQVVAAQRATNAVEMAAAREAQAIQKSAAAGEAFAVAQAKADAAAKRTNSSLHQLADSAEKNSEAWGRMGAASLGFGTAALLGVGMVIKSYADFDKQMSSVQAATHATGAELTQLRDLAVSAGADTSFSAKEAALGIEELSKAGVSTKDILGGGLAGALSLAAAGSLGVGESAEYAASAMTQFGLKGKDIPHIADLLAAGAGKAQGSVKDMGLALSYAGVPAAAMGVSIEKTTGAIALFAKSGIIGEKAGTALRAMLVSMANPAEKTQKLMDELGITFKTAEGKFVGLSGAAQVLNDRLRDKTEMERNAALAQIYGNEALGAALSLYKAGAEGLDKMTDAVNESGYAAETARLKQNNLAGDIEKLGGSMDSVFLKSGSGANEVLRGLVKSTEGLIDAIGDIDPKILQTGLGLVGLAGGAALVAGAFLTVFPKFMEAKKALDTLKESNEKAAGALGKVAKAAAAAGSALAVMQIASAVFTDKEVTSAEKYGQAILKVAKAGKDVSGSGMDDVFKDWDKVFGEERISNVNSMSDAVKMLFNHNGYEDFAKQFDGFNRAIGANISPLGEIEERLKGMGDAMGGLTKNGGLDTAAKSFQALSKEFENNGKSAKDALEAVPGYKSALEGLANESKVTLSDQELLDFAMGKVPKSMQEAAGGVQTYTNAAGEMSPVTEDMAKELEKLGVTAQGTIAVLSSFVDVMFRAGLLTLSERDAQRGYADALVAVGLAADGTGGKVGAMGTAFDNSTEQGKKNQAMFDAVAKAGISTTQAMANTTDAFGKNIYTQEQLQANLDTTFNNLKTAAGQFGVTGGAADELARKVMGIPPGVKVESWMSDYAKRMAEQTTGALNGIDGRVVNAAIRIARTVTTQVVGGGSADDPSMTALDPGSLAPNRWMGGLAGMAGGGVIPGRPPSRPNVDNILALVNGRPLKVRSGEFITNEPQTKANLPWLKAINAGLNMDDVMAAQPAGTPGMAGTSVQSSVINNHISVQTNASAQHIAGEIGWELRTK